VSKESSATTQRRAKPRKQKVSCPRIALALAGGGPLGGIYEVGALIALAESLDGVDLNELDVYVGVSSGGFVAAALANGVSPTQMYRLFIDGGADASLSPAMFLRPALGEFARRAGSLPRLLADATTDYLRNPRRRSFVESFAALGRAVPTGLFDQGAVDAFLARLFSTAGRVNDFRELRHKLFIVATNLDSGASVTFGEPDLDHVPISKAIEASAALPGLFPPVEIDGEHYVDGALNKTLHASVALEQGVELLLCVNPLVPFDAHTASRLSRLTVEKLSQGGLPLVLAQTFRAIVHSRMQAGMDRYERQYPDADIVLFEPDREDADMFFAGIFSYAHRKRLCETAYRNTRHSLLVRHAALGPMFGSHGIQLDLAKLRDGTRSIDAALNDSRPLMIGAPTVRRAAFDLSHTLDHLERWLAAAR
jgi:NTE family protein